MSNFPVHTRKTSPLAAQATLDAVADMFGFVPNLIGVMATSPALAEAYVALSEIFEKSGLNPVERQVVLLTVSHFHECRYCMAAHSMIAEMQQVPDDVIEAIRTDIPIADTKLEALRLYVKRLIKQRGWINETEMNEFLAAGYEPSHAFDVLVGVGQKILSNFTNHIANTPVDTAFEKRTWSPEKNSVRNTP
ncbi:MAG: carboxymuconolactone decarboxylase family protein [Porticoccus sp.]|nr:carboxymuconolactone decarboxylase family protein [Porticoccus sp.]